MYGTLIRAAAATQPAGALTVMIYHRVLESADPLLPGEPDAARFDREMGWVARWFNVMGLAEALGRQAAGSLPNRSLAITFDDGYVDNYRVALPILRKHGLKATFFIATDFLDGGRMFNDSVIEAVRAAPGSELDLSEHGLGVVPIGSPVEKMQAIGRILGKLKYLEHAARSHAADRLAERCGAQARARLMMIEEEVAAMRGAGMALGAHTCSHPILARAADADAAREIERGKARLESIVGEQVTLFAYPNGRPGQDYEAKHVDMVRAAGFRAAVSTAEGVMTRGRDVFQIPRFTPWNPRKHRFALQFASNLVRRDCATV